MSDATYTTIAPDQFRRTPWKNGGGVTIDIADSYRADAAPGHWDGVIWRFGRTDIVAAGPFSDFTGFERLQVVVTGRGLVLVAPGRDIDLREPFKVVRYDGGTPIVSRLEQGAVEVVNLIANRKLCAADLLVPRPGEATALPAGIHIVYAPADAASAGLSDGKIEIAAGHALRIDVRHGPIALEALGGTILVASIMPR